MIVGYARIGTSDQTTGLEAQERELRAAGAQRVFSEQVGVTGYRKALHEALDYARKGDVLMVTRLDRLARSVADLATILNRLRRKDMALRVLLINLDTTTPIGTITLNAIGFIAQFEHELTLERQRQVIAKTDGVYKRRKPLAPDNADKAKHLAGPR